MKTLVGACTVVLATLLLAGSVPGPSQKGASQKQQQSEIVLPAGTTFQARLNEALDTARNRPGDRFVASLHAPLQVNGKVVVPRGSQLRGHVTSAKPSGRLKGRGQLAVTLDSFVWGGNTYRISTSTPLRVTGSHKRRNLAWIGGGSGGGALIGGLAGGGPWALAAAGIGAGAGTAAAAITGKKHVYLPAESVIGFSLKQSVHLKERS